MKTGIRITSLRASMRLIAPIPLIVVLAGCGSDSNNTNGGNPGGGASTAQVRVLNAFIPPAGSNGTLTVSNNGTILTGANSVQFAQFVPTSGFMTVNSGTFVPSATGTGITTPLMSSNAISLTPNSQTTLVAVGASGTTGTTAPQLIAIPGFNPSTTTIPSGQAAVRFVNLSPSVGNVTLLNSVNGAAPTSVATATTNLGFGFTPVSSPFVFLPAGAGNTFTISSSSTTNTPVTLSRTGLNNLNLPAGEAFTILLVGQQGSLTQPFNAVVVPDFPIA